MYISPSLRSMLLFALSSLTSLAVATEAKAPPIRMHSEQDDSSKTPSLRGLIINGSNIQNPDRHPYFALMNENGLCGAVLISKRFVLTAAHCVGADDDFEIGITSRIPTFQAWLNGSDSDSGGTEYAYKKKIVHPDYNDKTIDSDIAIFELERDVPDSLPYVRLEQTPVAVSGTPMTVIGFGNTNPNAGWSFLGDDTSDILLQTTVDYVSQSDCIDQMRAGGGNPNAIRPTMLCAFEEGQDSCQGDSGGPLFLEGNTPEEDSLVGLVSWGYDCGGDTPGVYTRISYFYDWIVETMCSLNPAGVPEYVDCNTTVVTAPPEPISGDTDSGLDADEDGSDVGDAGDNDDFLGGIFDGNDDGDDDFLSGIFGGNDDGDDDFLGGIIGGNDDGDDDFLGGILDGNDDGDDDFLDAIFDGNDDGDDDFLDAIFDGNDDGDDDFFGLGLDELFGLSDDSTTDDDSYTIWEAVEGWVYSLFGS